MWLPDSKLISAIDSNCIASVQRAVLVSGADVNRVFVFDCDSTPLSKACEQRHGQIICFLLGAGANARWKDRFGKSAISKACSKGQLAAVQLLLHHDYSLLEIKDIYRCTPLVHALSARQYHIVRFLLNCGANVYGTISGDVNTLMIACQGDSLETVRVLLASGLDVKDFNARGKTALHYAAESRLSENMRELIFHSNANMYAANEGGETPFDVCLRSVNAAPLDPLLEGYCWKMAQNAGRLILHAILWAAKYSFAEDKSFQPPLNPLQIILPLGKLQLKHWRTLLDIFWGTDFVQSRDANGKLPLHIACRTNAPVEVLAVLVDLDPATLQMADYEGALPLHECCHGGGEYASVRYLVEQGGLGTLAARN